MRDNSYVVRPAVRDDIDFFYPNIEMKSGMRAWVLIHNEDRVAIGGLFLVKDHYTAFTKILRKIPAKTIWYFSKKYLAEIKKFNLPICAIREDNIPSSRRYLERLGFAFNNIQDNKETYILWQQQA